MRHILKDAFITIISIVLYFGVLYIFATIIDNVLINYENSLLFEHRDFFQNYVVYFFKSINKDISLQNVQNLSQFLQEKIPSLFSSTRILNSELLISNATLFNTIFSASLAVISQLTNSKKLYITVTDIYLYKLLSRIAQVSRILSLILIPSALLLLLMENSHSAIISSLINFELAIGIVVIELIINSDSGFKKQARRHYQSCFSRANHRTWSTNICSLLASSYDQKLSTIANLSDFTFSLDVIGDAAKKITSKIEHKKRIYGIDSYMRVIIFLLGQKTFFTHHIVINSICDRIFGNEGKEKYPDSTKFFIIYSIFHVLRKNNLERILITLIISRLEKDAFACTEWLTYTEYAILSTLGNQDQWGGAFVTSEVQLPPQSKAYMISQKIIKAYETCTEGDADYASRD